MGIGAALLLLFISGLEGESPGEALMRHSLTRALSRQGLGIEQLDYIWPNRLTVKGLTLSGKAKTAPRLWISSLSLQMDLPRISMDYLAIDSMVIRLHPPTPMNESQGRSGALHPLQPPFPFSVRLLAVHYLSVSWDSLPPMGQAENCFFNIQGRGKTFNGIAAIASADWRLGPGSDPPSLSMAVTRQPCRAVLDRGHAPWERRLVGGLGQRRKNRGGRHSRRLSHWGTLAPFGGGLSSLGIRRGLASWRDLACRAG